MFFGLEISSSYDPGDYSRLTGSILAILCIVALWIIGIPYIIYNSTKKYENISKTESDETKSGKKVSTISLEVVYWVFGVIIPGSIALHNFIAPGDSIASKGLRIFVALISVIIVVASSKFFWSRIKPPKYNIILFSFIAFILFLFSILTSMPY